MKSLTRIFLTLLALLLLFAPSLSLAESDYEEGDGWVYRDGTLTITSNDGLKDFVSNDQDDQTHKWKYNHSVRDVDTLVIGKDVSELKNEIYEWGQITPTTTLIASGNTSFAIKNGWVVHTKTNTLYGAADVAMMQKRTQIDNIPECVEHIGDGAFFDYQELISISIPKNVVSIGDRSFMWCKNLISFEFPEKLCSIGSQAFENCEMLKQIILDHSVGFIGSSAFSACTSTEMADIRNTKLSAISSGLFGACYKLQTLELPDGVIRIESLAFRICYDLHTLIINSSDLVVEGKAFFDCDKLNQIVFTKGTPQTFGETLFGETGKTADGKGYISNSSDRRGEVIPYPALYYTAAYADEWAPNGETEWNGYTIQQISQEELDAILAEARGETTPEPTVTPAQTAAATTATQPTAPAQEASKADRAGLSMPEILLLSAIAAVMVSIVVFVIARKRKGGK